MMIFTNANIFTRDRRFLHGSFRVEEGRFAALSAGDDISEGFDLQGAFVIPGLIDIHIHGAAGADASDGETAGLHKIGAFLAGQGVTGFAPTTMTLPYDVLETAFRASAHYAKERKEHEARMCGIHMEGPFFSEKKKGAQNGAYLKEPDAAAVRSLREASGNLLRLVCVAPELRGAVSFTEEISRLCTVSVAHTDAGYEEACAVFDAGARHVTHLFNAMPQFTHREPGVIGAASERTEVRAELIGDGFHLHPSTVRAAFRLFPGRICLISDALRCLGMPEGRYELGGQEIFLRDGVARLSDGTLAGSATSLYDCMLKVISFGIPREEAVYAATRLPAEEIGCAETIGAIAPGMAADFVICDGALNRKAVYLGGKRITAHDSLP